MYLSNNVSQTTNGPIQESACKQEKYEQHMIVNKQNSINTGTTLSMHEVRENKKKQFNKEQLKHGKTIL